MMRKSSPIHPDEEVACPNCGSKKLIFRLYNRECNRAYPCGDPNCQGCRDFIGSKGQKSFRYKCFSCNKEFTIIKRM